MTWSRSFPFFCLGCSGCQPLFQWHFWEAETNWNWHKQNLFEYGWDRMEWRRRPSSPLLLWKVFYVSYRFLCFSVVVALGQDHILYFFLWPLQCLVQKCTGTLVDGCLADEAWECAIVTNLCLCVHTPNTRINSGCKTVRSVAECGS